jgi:hypothetical protein
MVVLDTTFLTWVFVPGAKHPKIADADKRVEYLLSDLSGRGDQIVIPTPALSELLIAVGKARNAIIKKITGDARFIVAPFDLRAAIELSLMINTAISKGDKKSGLKAPWTKVKFDRQIIAIAKVLRVSCVYSDDADVHTIGKQEGVSVKSIADIAAPSASPGAFKLTPPGVKL